MQGVKYLHLGQCQKLAESDTSQGPNPSKVYLAKLTHDALLHNSCKSLDSLSFIIRRSCTQYCCLESGGGNKYWVLLEGFHLTTWHKHWLCLLLDKIYL